MINTSLFSVIHTPSPVILHSILRKSPDRQPQRKIYIPDKTIILQMRWSTGVYLVLIVAVVVYSGVSFCIAEEKEEHTYPPVKIDENARSEGKLGTVPAAFMIFSLIGLGIADRIIDARRKRIRASLLMQQYGYTIP